MTEAAASLAERATRLKGRRKAAAAVSFPDLVRLHFDWQCEVQANGSLSARARELEGPYRKALEAFEAEHGPIVNAYWCSDMPSAVALTHKSLSGFLKWFPLSCFAHSQLRFHRVSDWATKDRPDVAERLHECDELAIKMSEVLTGKRLRIAMQLIMSSAGHLLSLVDGKAAHGTEARTREALKEQRQALAAGRKYYRDAAGGQAAMVYSIGMMLGAAGLGLVAGLVGGTLGISDINDREFFGCLTAGAVGAVVSATSRISAGRFSLDFEVGTGYLIFLGVLRPLLGAIFGLALYFAVISGILDLFNVSPRGTARFYFLLVISFLAGFSERWAQDMLVGPSGVGRGTPLEEAEETPRRRPPPAET